MVKGKEGQINGDRSRLWAVGTQGNTQMMGRAIVHLNPYNLISQRHPSKFNKT